MPPEKTSVTGLQLATKSHSEGIQESEKLAPLQENTQSQAARSFNASAINSIPPEPHQEPSTVSPNLTDLPQPKGQKRTHVSEDGCSVGHLDKRLREGSQSVSESSWPLTEANLEEHNRLTGSGASDATYRNVETLGSGRRKRPRQASTNQETASMPTQTSSHTAAHYRFFILQKARISIQRESLPEEIRSRVNAIIQHDISEERKRELSRIAENLCNAFIDIFEGQHREDDCVEPIYHALSSMDGGKNFIFVMKAGIVFPSWTSARIVRYAQCCLDWNPSLKPRTRQNGWNPNFMHETIDEAGDTSQPAMLPPTLPLPEQNFSLVKTPRPDITVGLRHSNMVGALELRGLSKVKASDFLEDQVLYPNPVPGGPSIRFPPIVVEGKSYGTGKPVFEAQNQASVSGSCMTELQHELADLTKGASSGSYHGKATLAFSICTEGPYMELWVHYTTSPEGVRMYHMNILKICHASLPEGVTEFLTAVDGVMDWASVEFMNDVADQLVLVEGAVRRRHTG
ncbi:hypothetical protein FGG08_004576 [Glutinoglossum americanum]|uniref:DUF7924 domain-containing protein n=1 Tax=Glutinoglossum americanum TaxID=1670608 RepID=A0A9P8L3T3_9PEZI|nr:hypothetical protein FGG08_004576 [Glutinoglossum americanum]